MWHNHSQWPYIYIDSNRSPCIRDIYIGHQWCPAVSNTNPPKLPKTWTLPSSQVLKVNQEKWKRVYQRLCANGFTLSSLNLNKRGVFVSLMGDWLGANGAMGFPKMVSKAPMEVSLRFLEWLERHSLCFAPRRGCSRGLQVSFHICPVMPWF